jgi:putative transposase
MPRIPRAVLPGVPHHVTQRGVDRRDIFVRDADRAVYLQLVRGAAERFQVSLAGYCLMSNHVHWIVVPSGAESLAKTFGEAHGKYAHYANVMQDRSGHFWQNRFFSCALESNHLWAALRYVERNPVRAGLVEKSEGWHWSSAAAHAGSIRPPPWLDLRRWQSTFAAAEWREFLRQETLADAEVALRSNTYTGRPLGSTYFVANAEAELGRVLLPQKGGRPRIQKGAPAVGCEGEQTMLFTGE